MKPLKAIVCLVCVFIFSGTAAALEVPYLMDRVNDYAGILNSPTENQLEGLLKDHEARTGEQVVILTITGLEGEILEEYSHRVAQTWGIGKKGSDNGVLLLIASQDRALRIEVGYGLEARLTDAVSKRIIENRIIPKFKQGDYNAGITEGVTAILGVLGGTEEIGTSETPVNELQGNIGALFFFFIIISFFTLIGAASRGFGGWIMFLFLMPFWFIFPSAILSPSVGKVFFIVYLIGYPILRRFIGRKGSAFGAGLAALLAASGHRRGGFGGGGFGGGGFGGGGFGGGGGGFGGGGASGRW